ncbi:unnamed protein product [Adineta steineri]|uniref:Fork-head domain-containing protein n=1 Tax=Adineta steineri TaxID=433720 RepID=A0A818VG78_9BILA|nr:unnamed protein product [Adineta steineri]CAF3712049.1 unnamed protein product [Adineta steineri]
MLLATQQQLYDYVVRLRFGGSISSEPYPSYAFQQRYDLRFCQEPKPSYSYIGLIAMAILSSPDQQLVLSDIYQWILDHYPYFRARGHGWRNSIRHNLSLNDCFVKAGRSANGKGHYWSIHPANLADFMSGDFRRRRAQRRVRKSMGLAVPEDEDDDDEDEIIPINPTEHYFEHSSTKCSTEELHPNVNELPLASSINSTNVPTNLLQRYLDNIQSVAISRFIPQSIHINQNPIKQNQQKRCFDVDSLLAPEQPQSIKRQKYHLDRKEDTFSSYSKSEGSTDIETSV